MTDLNADGRADIVAGSSVLLGRAFSGVWPAAVAGPSGSVLAGKSHALSAVTSRADAGESSRSTLSSDGSAIGWRVLQRLQRRIVRSAESSER